MAGRETLAMAARGKAAGGNPQQMWRQADEAKYLGAEGALMFARVARAVRQTMAMERRLGAHADAITQPGDGQAGRGPARR